MIFIPLYKVCKGFPVYFVELKEDLEGVTSELVANERFWDYLRYHPAIMPSTGRNIFMTKLNSTRAGNAIRPVMLSKPTVYPHDWKTIVESETESNKDGKDTIKVLNNVYYHNKQPGKEYENTTRGLCRPCWAQEKWKNFMVKTGQLTNRPSLTTGNPHGSGDYIITGGGSTAITSIFHH
ncbi:hypothetical protein ZWY2020_019652 [Hordeum vulgare]|nr:hypothetical protein ZWY2020_019652 [Hordeum vulgare]